MATDELDLDLDADLDAIIEEEQEEVQEGAEGEGEPKAPVDPEKPVDPAAPVDPEKPVEGEPKDPAAPVDPEKPTDPNEPAKPETPVEPAQPLTADEVRSIMQESRQTEQLIAKDREVMTNDIMKAYYPEGLSNVLIDQTTGKELNTPQDVVDASGGKMTVDEAAQWLTNEQFLLNKKVGEIKESARELAEVNTNFRDGAIRVVQKYDAIFAKYPKLQEKVYKNYMKTVKMDSEKDLVLSAPDIEEYYGDFMEPYVMAFQFGQQGSAPAAPAAPAAPEAPAAPAPPKPAASDRMDEGGDGGTGKVVDKNNADESLDDLFGNG